MQLGNLKERCKLRQRGPWRSPGLTGIFCTFFCSKTHPVPVFCLMLCNTNNKVVQKTTTCWDNSYYYCDICCSSYTVKIFPATLRGAHVVHEVRLLQSANILSRSVKLRGIGHFRVKMAYLLMNMEKRTS